MKMLSVNYFQRMFKIICLLHILFLLHITEVKTQSCDTLKDTEHTAWRTWVVKDGKQLLIDRCNKVYLEADWDDRYNNEMDCPPFIDTIVKIEKNGVSCVYDIFGRPAFCENPKQNILYSYSTKNIIYTVKDGISGKTLYGYMDPNGNIIIPAVYEQVDHGPWSPYKAVKYQGLWGYIDEKGKMVIEPQFEEADGFYNGYAVIKKNGKCGLIDTSLKEIISCKYDWMQTYCSRYREVNLNGKFGLLDMNGNVVIQPKYSYIKTMSGNFFLANTNGEPEYKTNNMAFCHGGEWMVIDSTENIVRKLDCDHLIGLSAGLNRAEKNGKWGYMNVEGKWIIDPIFEEVSIFITPCHVKLYGKWGAMDETGKWILKPVFDELDHFECGLAHAKMKGKWGYVNEQYKWVIKPKYDSACEFFEINLK